jgi:SAM-dependent methyltransferase
MRKIDKTIEYYNKNANLFVETTANVEFYHMQNRFLSKLETGAHILDFGCGSGRDTKFFLEQGYRVDAIDGSAELCKLASEFTGIEVKHMYFQELSEEVKYDGIWACSSILHLNLSALEDVMKKMTIAVKSNGIIYTSFKYGIFSGERNGRYFTDMTEDTFGKLLQKIPELEIEEQWITSDVRPGRGEEQWLNLILRKN